MALRPPVKDLPVAEMWKVVEKALTGDFGTDKYTTLATVLDCADYAGQKAWPPGKQAATAMSEADGKAAIHTMAAGIMRGDTSMFPWLSIVQLILQLLANLGK